MQTPLQWKVHSFFGKKPTCLIQHTHFEVHLSCICAKLSLSFQQIMSAQPSFIFACAWPWLRTWLKINAQVQHKHWSGACHQTYSHMHSPCVTQSLYRARGTDSADKWWLKMLQRRRDPVWGPRGGWHRPASVRPSVACQSRCWFWDLEGSTWACTRIAHAFVRNWGTCRGKTIVQGQMKQSSRLPGKGTNTTEHNRKLQKMKRKRFLFVEHVEQRKCTHVDNLSWKLRSKCPGWCGARFPCNVRNMQKSPLLICYRWDTANP